MAITTGMLLKERYKIESVLGQGGMGAVYRATDELLSIPVAVKENLFLAEEYTKQFQQEAKILASLKHPALPRVIDFCHIAGQGQYLIMDYVQGEDLRDRILELGRLSEHDVGLIGYHICDVLSYMHHRLPPVIHRDIKPGNIKITEDSHIFLVDFGLAKVAESPLQMTITGARAMTPGYSPPEQYGTARTDERSDIYSLGATLYHALTGAVPEDALNRVTDKAELRSILEYRSGTEQKLVQVIEKAMEVDPEDRYQEVSEFQEALLDAVHLSRITADIVKLSLLDSEQSGEKESLSVDSRKRSSSKKRRVKKDKRSLNWGVAILLLLVLISISIFSLRPDLIENLEYLKIFGMESIPTEVSGLFQTEATDEIGFSIPSLTMVITETDEFVLTTATPSETFTNEPTQTDIPTKTKTPFPTKDKNLTEQVTPDEGQFLEPMDVLDEMEPSIVFASNRSGTIQLWLMDADGAEVQQLTNIAEGACQPDWSPNGNQIVFISPCRSIQDVYSEAILYLYDFEEESIFSVMPAEMGLQRVGNFEPAWSPDGTEIAFTSVSTGKEHIYIYEIEKGELKEISNSQYDDRQPSWHPDGSSLVFVRNRVNWIVFSIGKDGNGLRQLSWSGDVSNYSPVWTPDEKMILFSQTDDSNIPWLVKLYEANFGTTLEDNVYAENNDSQMPILGPKISTTGEKLLFESWPDGRNHDIYTMNLDGSELMRLTTNPNYDFDPDWRP